MNNFTEFYKNYTATLADYARLVHEDHNNGYDDFETTLERKYQEGFKDAMEFAFIVLNGTSPDIDEYETSCDDVKCKGDCDSHFCEARVEGYEDNL